MAFEKVEYIHNQTIISAQNMNDIQDELIRITSDTYVASLVNRILAALPVYNGEVESV